MIARLLLANVLELCIGLGVVCALRLPVGAAYLVGLVVVGIVSAHLALVQVAVGWTLLSIMATASLAVGYRFRPRPLRRSEWVTPWSCVGVALLAVLFVRAWPTFAAKPLDTYDGWAMWGMKAKGLFLLGGADPGLFASRGAAQLHLDYPLLIPSLGAVASRAMGSFDPRLIHLQFLLDGVAAFAAFAALLGRRAPGWLTWPSLLALAAAPAVTGQLVTAYADIPLAFLVAAGLVAAAGWVEDGDPRLLGLATLFFAGAVLTKNEGVIFVVAAYVGLLLATGCWRPLLLSALGVELALAPWQLWLHLHHVHSDTLLGLHLFEIHHPGIGPLAFRALVHHAFRLDLWPLLLPLFLASVVVAAGSRLAVFAYTWFLVSMIGLAWIYLVSKVEWSNYFSFSGDRVIGSVVIGAAALTPLLAAQAVRRLGSRKAPRAPASDFL
jgi:hypothetical protein